MTLKQNRDQCIQLMNESNLKTVKDFYREQIWKLDMKIKNIQSLKNVIIRLEKDILNELEKPNINIELIKSLFEIITSYNKYLVECLEDRNGEK